MKYKIGIEQHINEEVFIEANTSEEAMEIVMNDYKEGKFDIEGNPHVSSRLITVLGPEDEITEWSEF